MLAQSMATAPRRAIGRERSGLPPSGIREFSHGSLSDQSSEGPARIAVGNMTTPPELRWQAQRLLVEVGRAAEGPEKRILLDLVSKLCETALALEKAEGGNSPMRKPVKLGAA